MATPAPEKSYDFWHTVMKKAGFVNAVGEKNFVENIDAALVMAAEIVKK